jgi:methylmalonyl-CoA mutase C-terminal domain/subunit
VDQRKLRVLIAKTGFDAHDRGAKFVAVGLRDGGMEVVYTGCFQTVEAIASIAVQEDVDIVGLSILAGSHVHVVRDLKKLLGDRGREKIKIICGGIIPQQDVPVLKGELGVSDVFFPGTPLREVVERVRKVGGVKSHEL